jgi:dTDP-L-rhamnose 4-epimerase
MKVLVTGGAGFIGSHLVDELVSNGHYVRIFDNLEPQVHNQIPSYLNKDAEFMRGDMTDFSAVEAAIKDIDIIFHEAAMVGVGQSMYQVKRYVEANTAGTANLLDILVNKDHDVKKLVVASSMSIYGEGAYVCKDCEELYPGLRSDEQLRIHDWEMRCPHCNKYMKPVPTKENKPPQPTSIYAVTKKDQEETSLAIGRSYGLPTVALRYFNVYGPRQALSNPYTGVCAIFSSRIKNDTPPTVFEDGMQSRDFISVHDIVQANMLALKRSSANYEIFNVGSGRQTTILEIATILSSLYEKKLIPDVVNKYRSGDIRHCFADISKIKELGFSPSISFGEGMRELVYWGKTQEAEDQGDNAYNELKIRGLIEI